MNSNKVFRGSPHLISVLFLLLVSYPTRSQNSLSKFTHLSVDKGLSQSTIFAIAQDSQGFMWFGTRTGGLNKYDGHSFKVYKNDPKNPYSISGNEILKIFEDSRGRMWIGTRGFGLNRFDRKKERFYHYLNKEITNSNRDFKTVTSVVEDYKGRIWISSLGGLCLYDEEKDEFVPYKNTVTNRNFTGASSLCLLNDSILCLGNKRGVHLIDANSKQVIREFMHDEEDSTSISANRINFLFSDSKSRLWVGTRKNGLNLLKSLSDSSFVRYSNDPSNQNSLVHNVIRVIAEDKDGTIWIGTSGGLDKLNPGQQNRQNPIFIHYKNDPNNPSSLSQNVIFSFFEDSNNNLWVGTWSSGINYLNINDKKFKHFTYNMDKSLGMYNSNVTCFTENEFGLWVGTDEGGISIQDRKNEKFIRHIRVESHPHILKNGHIRSLYADERGIIWIGTFDGLTRLDTRRDVAKYLLPDNHINSITRDAYGILWVGAGDGLYRYDVTDHFLKKYIRDDRDPGSLADNNINYIHCDTRRNLWIGTKRGLHLYDRKTDSFIRFHHSPNDPTSLSNDNVITISSDDDGKLWIGTYNGLNKFNPADSSFICFSDYNGLPDNVINGIVPGDNGELWLSSNKGLIELFHFETTKGDSISVRHFTEEDGLQSNEFIRHSYYKTREGEILFGGLNGFNMFHPDSIELNLAPPRVSLTELLLFNQPVMVDDNTELLDKHISYQEKIKISPDQTVLTLHFASLNYTSPIKNKFAYILEGFEENWNYVGNRHEATYTSLPPGDYKFKVTASNNDGIWSEKGTELAITVLPRWWQHWWFRIFVAVGFILITVSIYWFRVKTLERRQNNLKRVVQTRTAELQEVNLALEEKNRAVESQKNAIEAAYEVVQTLSKIGKEITMTLSAERIMDITYEHLYNLIEIPFFAIGLYDEDRNCLVYKGSKLNGVTQDEFIYELTDPNRIGVWCFNNQQSTIINDFSNEYPNYIDEIVDFEPMEAQPNSVIYLPLNVKKKRIGVISVQSPNKGMYTKHHSDILENIAIYTAIALDNAYAYDKIEKQTAELIEINSELQDKQNQVEKQIAELSHSEEELSRLNDELTSINQQLLQQQIELENTIDKLKSTQTQLLHAEKMSSIGILTAGVAHEINNPLNFILGGKVAIEDYMHENLTDHMERLTPLLEMINNGIERSTTIIRSLNRFNRKSDVLDEKCDIVLILNNCLTILRNTLKNKVKVTTCYTEEAFTLMGNEGELHQLFINILTNAEQAIQSSGTVSISTELDGNYLLVEVQDTGSGISEENIKRVTEPFFTTKAPGKGTGLGMSIVYSIIKRHKGRINIESEIDKGSTVTVKLPVLI